MNTSNLPRRIFIGLLIPSLSLLLGAQKANEAPERGVKTSVFYGYLIVQRMTGGANAPMNWEAASVEQNTHIAMLKSVELIDALTSDDKLPVRESKWAKQFKYEADVVHWFNEHFHVEPVAHSRLIKLSVDGASEEDAKMLINNVEDIYVDRQRSIATNSVLDAFTAQNKLLTKTLQERRESQERLNNQLIHLGVISLAADGSVTTPQAIEMRELLARRAALIAEGKDANDALDKRIATLESKLGDQSILMADLIETRARLTKLNDRIDEIKSRSDAIEWTPVSPAIDIAEHATRAME